MDFIRIYYNIEAGDVQQKDNKGTVKQGFVGTVKEL